MKNDKKEFPRMMVSDNKKNWFKVSVIGITNLGFAIVKGKITDTLYSWKYHKEIDEPKQNNSLEITKEVDGIYVKELKKPKPKKKKLVELLKEYNDKVCKIFCWMTTFTGEIEVNIDGITKWFKSKKELKKFLIKEIEKVTKPQQKLPKVDKNKIENYGNKI